MSRNSPSQTPEYRRQRYQSDPEYRERELQRIAAHRAERFGWKIKRKSCPGAEGAQQAPSVVG